MADGKLKMPQVNECKISGRVTAAPTVKYSTDGNAYVSTQLAYSTGFGEKRLEHFVSLKAFRKTAERIGELRMGAPVLVSGRLEIEKGKDGDGCYPTVYANMVWALDWEPDSQPESRPAPRKPEPTPGPQTEDDVPF